jgi:hypothetical protein
MISDHDLKKKLDKILFRHGLNKKDMNFNVKNVEDLQI